VLADLRPFTYVFVALHATVTVIEDA